MDLLGCLFQVGVVQVVHGCVKLFIPGGSCAILVGPVVYSSCFFFSSRLVHMVSF
jgi:hypothetical protein